MSQKIDPLLYAFQPRSWVAPEGQTLRYLDEGSGPPLVMVHGTPSWSFEYRHLVAHFRSSYRCLALDHLGFGASSKPPHADYRIQAHAHRFAAWLDERQLDDVTLVIHDFGGPVALAWALAHPEKVRRIVVLNSWLWDFSAHPVFRRSRALLRSPLLPLLYRYLNASPRFLLPRAMANPKQLPKKVHRHYLLPFPTPSSRHAPLAIARGLLHEQPWFDALWEQRDQLRSTPMQLIWGVLDPLLPPDFANTWAEGFPWLRVHRLPDCGHFPTEEAPEKVISLMEQFDVDAR